MLNRLHESVLACLLLPITVVAFTGCADNGDSSATVDEGGDQSLSATSVMAPLVMTVPAPARPVVTTDEQRHWLYEIVFQNSGTTSARVTRLDVSPSERPGDRTPYRFSQARRRSMLTPVLRLTSPIRRLGVVLTGSR